MFSKRFIFNLLGLYAYAMCARINRLSRVCVSCEHRMRLIERTILVDDIFRAENKEINTQRGNGISQTRTVRTSYNGRKCARRVKKTKMRSAKWKKGTKANDAANKQEIKM